MKFKTLSLGKITETLRGMGLEGLVLEGDPELEITGMAGLEEAGPGDLGFLSNPRYTSALATTRAGAVIVSTRAKTPDSGSALLRTDLPYLAFARALQLLVEPTRPTPGIHPGAHVDPTAFLGPGATVMAGAFLGPGCKVGADTIFFPGAVVMGGCQIGSACLLYPGVIVREDCTLGNRVILHPNVNIGGDGYGFVQVEGRHEKVPQVGTVLIEDDVEIGAGSCVDRGTLNATVIGRGTKIDDLVMIGHGGKVGAHALIVAQSGMAGSAVLEDHVTMGARAGVLGHLTVGAGSVVFSRAHVTKSVPPNSQVSGNPARPHADQLRQEAFLRKMEKLLERVNTLEKEVARLKSGD